MKTKLFRISRIVMLAILILVLVTLTAGVIVKSKLAKQHPAPGQLVDVGGYKMHINCTGQGSPTVILDAGFADYSATWAYVQPEVDPSPYPRTASWRVDELHTLLVNANVQGPYVLVGHSLGGMLMRVYAHNYPDEVVGMVLVDSMHEEQYDRLPGAKNTIPDQMRQFRMLGILSSTGIMALMPQAIPNPEMPDEIFAQNKMTWATTGHLTTAADEISAMLESTAEVRSLHITSFGDLPLRVLSQGLYYPNPTLSEDEDQEYHSEWQAMQSELAALSSTSKHTIAEQSGHAIQYDQPDLVVDAILDVVDAIR